MNRDELAHELWAAAQLAPGEGISDAVARMNSLLAAQPAEAEGVEVVAWLLEGGRFYMPSVETTEERADRRIAERKDETVKSPLVRLAALSAVTAERDRLRKANNSRSDKLNEAQGIIDQLRAEVERLLGAMRQIRYASNNGPVSENNAGCIRRIEQIADAAMAAKEA